MSYKLRLDIFEGPLDLLLYLIRKNELDICEIAISEITDQYLEYIKIMKELDLDIVGDFLVMAATLMQIKSRQLLPPDPEGIEQQEEEDPADELVRRLLEYKRFKEAAGHLHEKAEDRKNLFSRIVDEEVMNEIRDDATEVYFEANLFDLITAFNRALAEKPKKVMYEVVKEEWTVEAKVHDILHMLVEKPSINLNDVFKKATHKREIVVTFIAVLELIKQREVKIIQLEMFGNIEVVRNDKNIEAPHHNDEGKPHNPFGDTNGEEGIASSSFEENEVLEPQEDLEKTEDKNDDDFNQNTHKIT